MRILCFSDIHGNIKALRNIVAYSKKVDLVICAGDFTEFSKRIQEILSILNTSKSKVLIIPGNHEDPKVLEKLCKNFKNLIYVHKKHIIINDVLFIGYGTGGFSIKDPDFVKFAKSLKKELSEKKNKIKVLITHAPPFDSGIDFIDEEERMPLGNKDIRNFILKNNIDVCISGHFHERAGTISYIGKTIVINPGNFFIIEIIFS
ncbi:MAG: metallophosphoesterase [Candidatus Woesearchaeota archaeon]